MSDPADLINVAIESLLTQGYELPAFSTLDRLAGRIRYHVHEQVYRETTQFLTEEQKVSLDQLLKLREDSGITDFTCIKQVPGKPTLKCMNEWALHLKWLSELFNPKPFIQSISYTLRRQFAAQAQSLEVGDMKDITNAPRRYTLLLCLLYQAQVQTRDELVVFFLKRMKQTHNQAKEKLKELQDKARETEEKLMAVFSQVLNKTAETEQDDSLGHEVRSVIDDHGGTEELLHQYEIVFACHNNNYLPLLWDIHRHYHTAIFRLLDLLIICSSTTDCRLIQALTVIRTHQNSRKQYLNESVDISFASQRWQELIQVKTQDGHQITLVRMS
jgi:hypothetical protein